VKTLDLGKQLSGLLAQLAPFLPKIREIKRQLDLDAEISCAVYIEEQAPVLHLDRNVVEMANQLEAEIDIDVYVFP
jgi:hypothetical protein